jgi:hypothetical protein
MKQFLVGILMLMVLAIVLPLSVSGQSYCRKSFRGSSARYSNAYYGNNYGRYRNRRSYRRSYNRQPVYYSSYRPAYYTTYSSRRPSFYRRHRNVMNMAIGTGAGAVIGGLLGGRRGAGWGALTGAGASALYTYKLRPKQRRYYRY